MPSHIIFDPLNNTFDLIAYQEKRNEEEEKVENFKKIYLLFKKDCCKDFKNRWKFEQLNK